jgi:hypothetical protein
MFMPAKVVNADAAWHFSHGMPTAGTCVAADGAVGEPPAARGGVFGWYVIGGGTAQAACVAQPAKGPPPAPAE